MAPRRDGVDGRVAEHPTRNRSTSAHRSDTHAPGSTEKLYSGVYGTEMQVDIFMGVVYYQRLRHMVSDKHQVLTLTLALG